MGELPDSAEYLAATTNECGERLLSKAADRRP